MTRARLRHALAHALLLVPTLLYGLLVAWREWRYAWQMECASEVLYNASVATDDAVFRLGKAVSEAPGVRRDWVPLGITPDPEQVAKIEAAVKSGGFSGPIVIDLSRLTDAERERIRNQGLL